MVVDAVMVYFKSCQGQLLVQCLYSDILFWNANQSIDFSTKSQLKGSRGALHENQSEQTGMSKWMCWRSVDKQQSLQGRRAPRLPGPECVCACVCSELLERVHRWRSGGGPTRQRIEQLPTWQITCDLWEMRQLFRPTLTCHRRLPCPTPHSYLFRFSSAQWETETDLWPRVSLKIFMGLEQTALVLSLGSTWLFKWLSKNHR